MCVQQLTCSNGNGNGSLSSSAAAETATRPIAPSPRQAAQSDIKAAARAPSLASATLPPRVVNLSPLLMPTAAPTGEHDDQLRSIFFGGVGAVAKYKDSPTPLALGEDAAQDEDDGMGQCYPKCMSQVDGLDDGRVLPGMRAKRASKQRTNLGSMKKAAAGSNNDNDTDCDDSCLDFNAIGRAMGALDLEELARDEIVNGLFAQPPKSIVVDYEEAPDVAQQRRPRQGSVSDCARDACRPLDDEYAKQNPAEELFSTDVKSTPVTPGRRRSRQDSFGNSSNLINNSSSSSVMTPRRGKSVILENAKVVQQDPASPLTDTDASESDADLRCSSVPKLCLCEVKLHTTRDSCWLIANKEVFDVTGILDVHPGGPRSILRKAGGPDCTQDMKFHTKNARNMLDKCFIGKLQPCGDEPERPDTNCSIM